MTNTHDNQQPTLVLGGTGKTGRRVVECPLARDGDTYVLDLEDAQERLSGDERVLLWCSPQNPSGRVWSAEELCAVAEFAERNDLILVSDEIHHDLVFPGAAFVPMHVAAPEAEHRMVILTAASKTFNIAGARNAAVTIPEAEKRKKFRHALLVHQTQPNLLGVELTAAAYTPRGAEWVDELVPYIAGNAQVFNDGVGQIPGVVPMPMQSTYLAWVDFAGTGMEPKDFIARVEKQAKIAVNHGNSFGAGGDNFLRFNLATQRAVVVEAAERLKRAFADLQ
mgnify:CR=1 FL=1